MQDVHGQESPNRRGTSVAKKDTNKDPSRGRVCIGNNPNKDSARVRSICVNEMVKERAGREEGSPLRFPSALIDGGGRSLGFMFPGDREPASAVPLKQLRGPRAR